MCCWLREKVAPKRRKRKATKMGLFSWLNDKVTQVREQVFGSGEGGDADGEDER